VYWYEGIEPSFSARREVEGLAINLGRLQRIVRNSLTALLLLGLFGAGAAWFLWWRGAVRWQVAPYFYLMVPAVLGLGLFVASMVEARYIAGLIATLLLASLASIRLRHEGRFPLRGLAAGLVLIAVCLEVMHVRGGARHPDQEELKQHLATAGALTEAGVGPGSRVGVLGGPSVREYWARLARVQIIAEIPQQETDEFWRLSPAAQREVLSTFARCGAVAVVARRVPESAHPYGWRPVADGVCIYVLTNGPS
jgi:hypothetical protein